LLAADDSSLLVTVQPIIYSTASLSLSFPRRQDTLRYKWRCLGCFSDQAAWFCPPLAVSIMHFVLNRPIWARGERLPLPVQRMTIRWELRRRHVCQQRATSNQ